MRFSAAMNLKGTIVNKRVILTGDNVRLRPMSRDDLALRVQWYNDRAVRKTLVMDEVFELEKTQRWFESLADNSSRADFVVETLDGIPLAVTGIINIDSRNQTAECYCVIGEKEFWGKGLGTEIHSVLFQWAFDVRDICKIWAHIRTNNPAIFRVVEKLGFQIEGTLREHSVVEGQRIDLYTIGLLRDEFLPSHKHFEINTAGG